MENRQHIYLGSRLKLHLKKQDAVVQGLSVKPVQACALMSLFRSEEIPVKKLNECEARNT